MRGTVQPCHPRLGKATTGSYSHGVQRRGHLLYWEEPSAFIGGEPAVQDGSVYSFTVLDRLLQQAFQPFPNLATVTVTVSTILAVSWRSNLLWRLEQAKEMRSPVCVHLKCCFLRRCPLFVYRTAPATQLL